MTRSRSRSPKRSIKRRSAKRSRKCSAGNKRGAVVVKSHKRVSGKRVQCYRRRKAQRS